MPNWSRRLTLALPVLLGLLGATGAAADEPSREAPLHSNAWGGSGLHASESAATLPAGSLSVGANAQGGAASNLFQQGDSLFLTRETLGLVWAPVAGLEVGIDAALFTSQYAFLATLQRQSLGNPTLHLKYAYAFSPAFQLGLALTAHAPTAQSSATVVPGAGAVSAQIVAGFVPTPGLELLINAGYVVDRGNRLAADLTDDTRLGMDLGGDRAVLMLGAYKPWAVGSLVALGPWVELGGSLPPQAVTQSTAQASGGIKVLVDDRLEFTAGATARLWGSPQAHASYPGLMPWQALVQASLRLGVGGLPTAVPTATAPAAASAPVPPAAAPAQAEPLACMDDTMCAEGERCHTGHCVLVEIVEKPAPAAQTTFVLVGQVHDSSTGKPVPDARLTLSGFEGTALTVDGRDAAFKSWPLPTGEGLLEVRAVAPGYKPFTQVLPRGAAGGEATLIVQLAPADQVDTAILKGSFSNGKTGDALGKGVLFIPKLRRKVPIDAEGNFSLALKPGVYDVVLFAKGYVSQRKRLRMREGDVLILNAELQPTRRGRATP